MPKYLSGRVKRTPQDKLTEDRYLYLGLDQAEPNLGDPPEIDTIPPGQQYQIVSLENYPGERFWKPIGGGTIPAAHTVRDEGVVVPKGGSNPNLGINSITDVNFVGAAVTVLGFIRADGSPGTSVTVTVFAPGDDHGVLFNNNGDFATSSLFTFDNTVGIESVGIGTNLRVQGDLKLDKTIYGENNQPGNQGDLLVKTATGGMIWQNQNAIRSGAGGTIYDIQFHNTSGLVDGASTNGGKFVYRSDTGRVGIGSTIPEKLLDVIGNSRFTGNVEFVTSNENNILFDDNDNSLIFGDSVKAKFGSDKDASIYHDDTDFYIDNGKGNLILSVGVETAFLAVPNNRVELFYNNLKKFETTNTGIAVTGTDHLIHGEVGIQSHIKLPDNAKIQFGVNQNLEIFRDTSDGDSKIRESGTGNLRIEGSDIIFRNSSIVPASDKIYARFNDGGSVELYHNNIKKFETSGIGVTITGLTTTTDLSVTGFVTSHLIPGETEKYDLGSVNNAWRKIYAKTIIGVDNEEFNFLKVGILTVSNELHVSGISSFVGIATFNDLHVTNLEVTGISTFVGIATFGDGIHVQSGVSTFVGFTTFNDGVMFTGISTFNDNIIVAEQKEIQLGGNKDLRLYHDGHSIIQNDESAACLFIASHETRIANTGLNKIQAKFGQDGAVELYYDNGKKIATSGVGVTVTGVTSTTNLYVTGVSTFNNDIRTESDLSYDIGTESVGFRTVYAKEFNGKSITLEEDLTLRNLKVNGISTFIGIATFGDGINVMSGVTTVGFLTAVNDIFVAGVVTATDFNSTSDAKLKTNIQVIDNPIEKIMKIDGVSFNWKATNKPSFGVIADNVQETLPDLVNNEDPKTVNYNGLVGLLIEVVKNQQEQINELRGLLDK